MTVTLNTADISNFTQLGGQTPSTSSTNLAFSDADVGDVSSLFAPDTDAAPGSELDLVATFQIRSVTPNGPDTGFRVIINDGIAKAAVATCAVINNQRVLALAGPGAASDPATYLASTLVDWKSAPVSIRLRRLADGGAELMEINGAAPNPRVVLTGDQVTNRTRTPATAELGCMSPASLVDVDVTLFRTEKVAKAVAGKLTFTRFRMRDTDSADKLAFRTDYTLGATTNGIDPLTEPVVIALSNGAGQFYTQTLNGFAVKGNAPRRRWILNDAEKARTGIEQLVIDEDPNNAGGIFLRDIKTDLGTGDFSNITAEITIGTGALADKLSGTAALVQMPSGSGKWRYKGEP